MHFPKIDTNDLFVFSDPHWSHKNLVYGVSSWPDKERSTRRFDTVEEMNGKILQEINSKAGKNSTLLCLGDWSFGGRENIKRFRESIVCDNVYLVLGNHDHHIREKQEYRDLFTWVGDYLEFYYKRNLYCCMHYPLGSWNDIGKGAIQLHGHCHNNYLRPLSRQIDVGLDAQDMQIRSIEWIHQYMLDKPIVNVDHHDKNS